MPSNKPQILIRTDKEIIEKLDIIANKDNRSRSNMAEQIIIEYIKNYESNNGNINTGDINITGKSNTVRIGHTQK